MADETLAKPVIELSLDDIKLKDSWEKVVQDSLRFGKAVENAFKGSTDTSIKKTTLSMKEFYKATETSKDKADKLLNRLKDINKLSKMREPALPKTFDFATISQAASGAGQAAGRGIAVGVAATGLAFAGAAAAGSTTLDTLTGSFKMLALTIGSTLQPAILKFSDIIQSISNAIERNPKVSAGIGMGTAGLGTAAAAFAVTKNPIAAGVAGATAAIVTGMSELESKREAAIEKVRHDPNLLIRKNLEATKLEQAGEDEKARIIRDVIREAEKRNREGFRPETGLRAGLNRPASFSALGDVRIEGQLAGFGKGPLDIANEMKELSLNIKALTGVNREIVDNSKKPDKDQHNPPS